MTSNQVSPGWYPDPSGAHQLRYFGTTWSDQVSNGGVVSVSPVGQLPFGSAGAAPAPPPGWPMANHAMQPVYGAVGAPAFGRVKTTGPVLVLIGAVLMILGPLLPWETVSAPSLYTGSLTSVKGTSEGAGPLVLVAGLVAGLLAVLILTKTIGRRRPGIATMVIAAVSLIFMFGNWSGISKDIDKAPHGVSANIGIGLIFAVVGGILAAVASVGLVRNRT